MGVLVRVLGVVLAIACAIALVLMLLGIGHIGPFHNGVHSAGYGRVMMFTGVGCVAGILMALTGRMPGKDDPRAAQARQQAQGVSPDEQRTQFIQTQQSQQGQQGWQGQQQPQYPPNQQNQQNQPGDGQSGWQDGQGTGPWGR